jgi:hypothetical protein
VNRQAIIVNIKNNRKYMSKIQCCNAAAAGTVLTAGFDGCQTRTNGSKREKKSKKECKNLKPELITALDIRVDAFRYMRQFNLVDG